MTTSLLKSAARALLLAFAALLGAGPAVAQTVEYVHTDALGSVVAVTNAAGVVIERREYEPYGQQLTPAVQNGPGYTAHVQDAATGLTYMQQRYYDPLLGRFLSVDPVTMHDTGDPRHFARYGYANNNPYIFYDPDGRVAFLIPVAIVAWRAYSAYDTVSTAAASIDTLSDESASTSERVAAGAELVGSLVGGKSGRTAAGGIVRAADAVVDGRRVGNLPKPPTGPGTVPKEDRDPKRLWTPSERSAKREEQGGVCATGCDTPIDEANSRGHHIERHADGGRTVSENHAEVCEDCHLKLHSRDPE